KDLVCSGHLLLEHPAGDLVDRIMTTDILHINQWLVSLRQHTAVNGARLKIERRRRVDFMGERVKPGCAQTRLLERYILQRFHQVSEDGALRAAGSLHLFF